MTASEVRLWSIEPHIEAKHAILNGYLGAWFPILGRRAKYLIYIDGFSGPGKYSHGEPGSPVLALQQALGQHSRLQENYLVFFLGDKDQANIDHLSTELGKISRPRNVRIEMSAGEFEPYFKKILEWHKQQCETVEPKIPILAFLDPFDNLGIPLLHLKEMLSRPQTEFFLNFMPGSLRRWLYSGNAEQHRYIERLFGTRLVHKLKSHGGGIDDFRRLYQAQLKKCARFVRYFEMKKGNKQAANYLFFASNSRNSYLRMKRAVWNLEFQMTDATDAKQPVLMIEGNVPKLANMLRKEFAERTVTVQEIKVFVDNETVFLDRHKTAALNVLEENEKITVNPEKSDGSPRQPDTFEDEVLVTFQ